MKTYTITSVSAYHYSAPATHGYHMARMLPRTGGDQNVESATLTIEQPVSRHGDQLDFFANAVRWFAIEREHASLTLTMRAQVRVARPPSLLTSTISWREATELARATKSLAPESPAHFLRPTQYTLADAPLRIFGARFFAQGSDIAHALEGLNQTIRDELTYDPEATSVATTANDAFALSAGVCQDFAHIMIAACRGVGLPARYVSGYIRTDPPPGKTRLEGADAMHAWVSVWCGPVAGWVDYDPTNGCLVGEDHITVAVGRDYQDTAPVRGEVVGGGVQSHKVAVDVVELG